VAIELQSVAQKVSQRHIVFNNQYMHALFSSPVRPFFA
jgi:hypothetical protein